MGSLDHVDLFVPDRYEAAAWYEEVLGLEIVKQQEDRCKLRGGPLMISSDGGATMLALFRSEPLQAKPQSSSRLVAFRTTGEQFLRFIDRAAKLKLRGLHTPSISRRSITDHDHSLAVYFTDPWGNELAVTTYDLHKVRSVIGSPLGIGIAG